MEWFGPDGVDGAAKEHRLLAWLAQHGVTEWRSHRNVNGWSLLHFAALGGDVPAVVALLRHGLDANTPCLHGVTPVHHAAAGGKELALRALLAAGGAVNTRNGDADTPLDWALSFHEPACARLLLLHGASLHLRRSYLIDLSHHALSAGVRACRSVVVALLGIKRRRGPELLALDKFVVAFIGVQIWITRGHASWQPKKQQQQQQQQKKKKKKA